MTFILILIGLFAGALSGLLGIGGGLVIVPALVYIAKMTQHQAQGTTLALMLPPITLLSVYAYHKAGNINWTITLFVCIGFFVGSYFGGDLANRLPEAALRKMFAIFLMVAAVHMFFKK